MRFKSRCSCAARWNSFGDEGARAIARGLAQNRGLATLLLASNDIGAAGAAELAAALKAHADLQTLDLSCNRTADAGAAALADALGCGSCSLRSPSRLDGVATA